MTPFIQLQTCLPTQSHTWLITGVAGFIGSNLRLSDPQGFKNGNLKQLKEHSGSRFRAPEITLDDMVQEMVARDLQKAKQHALLKQNGYSVSVSVSVE